ncbi:MULTISPECIES: hotdog family protein [Halopseudomonas]|uniref:N-terminal of MaoC-like dehydratase domain-containing protein n=1 Tax=Halopseudomonas bauzanensis TaxID=653930 RepID=A0A031MDP0_9GAMM|nr:MULTISPECIES: hypothetical protein [Halopseudomonas]EZQ18166.1 hypothetical protein CF98_26085 [Halopseudomonas bauzanensis]WGK61597.1 hypothetical protein QAO71_16365 [Halopseudomonas sp. SMJS2]SER84276.1 hypothetical protein SAMN05216589_1533 [Halopseudomonas bauzanensis]SFL95696.1 hypothetical protein SAMN04487855_1781 [Halopseudomonas bauzanensis]
MSFDTPLYLCGPLREPKQMLADQQYSGHTSIHDDDMAEKLGFRAGPIEGPTHFSQFTPLLVEIWGQDWFERGCFSAHFQNMVVEGEQVRAFVERPAPGATRVRCWAEKADGTPVLEASASIGDAGPSLLDERMARLRPPERLVILADLQVGMTGAEEERVRMDADQHMGELYPFSLNQKLERITENSPWYSQADVSPWGRPIIPLEMVSVLAEYSSKQAAFPVRQPVIGLFADQEIRMIDGPLLVGEDYLIRREVVALSESKRTESYWVRSRIYSADGSQLKAEMLLNHATLKHSYADYPQA